MRLRRGWKSSLSAQRVPSSVEELQASVDALKDSLKFLQGEFKQSLLHGVLKDSIHSIQVELHLTILRQEF